jgi:hypothetical protein
MRSFGETIYDDVIKQQEAALETMRETARIQADTARKNEQFRSILKIGSILAVVAGTAYWAFKKKR